MSDCGKHLAQLRLSPYPLSECTRKNKGQTLRPGAGQSYGVPSISPGPAGLQGSHLWEWGQVATKGPVPGSGFPSQLQPSSALLLSALAPCVAVCT